MVINPTNIDVYQGADTDKDALATTANALSVYLAEDTDTRYLLGTDKVWYPFDGAFYYFKFL